MKFMIKAKNLRAVLNKIQQDRHKGTSIKECIKPTFDIEQALINNPDFNPNYLPHLPIKPLSPFEGNSKSDSQNDIIFRWSLPRDQRECFGWNDYLTRIDTTGRI
ncbi:MAG: hypothetical protein ACI93R_002812 [Flavobacteriales bacterium]|jgi:hypothetical protein